jgi:hypothetical protein
MFHDSTFLGWLATGMYVAATVLCACAIEPPPAAASAQVSRAPHSVSRGVRAFWLLLTIALGLLAINKQLDLQTALTDLLRGDAERGGWYSHRRKWQIIFVMAAALLAGGAAWTAVRLLGRQWRSHRLVLAGIAALAAYLMLRVVDIERVGEMTGLPLSAHRLRDALEWAGLLMIAVAAWRRAIAL